MVAHLVTSAPTGHLEVLLGGLFALKDELNWFREKAKERSLILGTARQEMCEKYCQFMRDVRSENYPVQAVAFWAIELGYNQAWQLPGPMVQPYDEFTNRWGNLDFAEYVKVLETQANDTVMDTDLQTKQGAKKVSSRKF
jgi:thiaminase/transcriptional activator TenA